MTQPRNIGEAAEPVRQAMMAIIADTELILRKVRRAARRSKGTPDPTLAGILETANHIDEMVRTLYAVLPDDLRTHDDPRDITPDPDQQPRRKKRPARPHSVRIPREVRYPPLTEEQILGWADAFYEKNGKYPSPHSGKVREGSGDKWMALDMALKLGLRGLPGGTTLSRLIAANRVVHVDRTRKKITFDQISEWVDAYHARTGEWPQGESGEIPEAPGETWRKIDSLIRRRTSQDDEPLSLAKYLHKTRGVRIHNLLPPLTEEQILRWVDSHLERTGALPTAQSGEVADAPGEFWSRIDTALIGGQRSLPKGGSLPKLLAVHRGRKHKYMMPPIELEAVSLWVLNHYTRHGRLPRVMDGAIDEAPDMTWSVLDNAFRAGRRGLADSGYKSLKDFLQSRFPRPEYGQHAYRLRPLTFDTILAWADAHYARTGAWPTRKSGAIPETQDEVWARVCHCMERGLRGLKTPLSLTQLLAQRRGVPDPHRKDLTLDLILMWADAHYARTGCWPNMSSGEIPEAPTYTWDNVNNALNNGNHGLPKLVSLASVLHEHRDRRHRRRPPPLNLDAIEAWARSYVDRFGHRPSHYYGGRVEEAPEETWRSIIDAFKHGKRGLDSSGFTSLSEFLTSRLGPSSQSRHTT